jgi:F-type H+-transporting ATPase subunit epsilon
MAENGRLQVKVVTQSGTIYTGGAEEVVAPGSEGQLGILPSHAPLMTTLQVGAMHIKHNGDEETLFIGGGFMEVYKNQVTILADDAERASDIDEAKAEEARRSAEQHLQQRASNTDAVYWEAQLQRAIARLRVAEMYRARNGRRRQPLT